MRALFLLTLLAFAINRIDAAAGNEAKECEYIHDERTYFCKNIFDTFPNVFYGNYHLKCVKCNIRIFSDQTFPYQNSLVSFNVSNSGIQFIRSKAFSSLGNIQFLYLHNNQIINVSIGAFAGLRQVHELHLENNLITDLTPGFLQDLEANSIILHNNKISELPSNIFDGGLSIMTIELQSNRINKLYPDTFYGLESLEYLELHNNRLCHIPLGVFKHLRTLRHLNLANNKLSTFPIGVFSGLQNLHSLNLANNTLTVFDGSILLPFLHLSQLDISGNGIYYLDANGVRANAPTMRTMTMDDNIFSCSLLGNVIRYFKSVNVEILNSVGRYEVQNVNGIACVDDIVTESISFKHFLKEAEAAAKKYVKYC